jgi:hypothetical protein
MDSLRRWVLTVMAMVIATAIVMVVGFVGARDASADTAPVARDRSYP